LAEIGQYYDSINEFVRAVIAFAAPREQTPQHATASQRRFFSRPLARARVRRNHGFRDEMMTKEAPMTPGDTEPSQSHGGETPVSLAPRVTFDRRELDRIFRLYGRKVAAGEWRDYAIDFLKDRAVFSVFRRSSEAPLYRIEKDPRLARRQGTYSVISATGLIVRRGHELDRVLRAIDRSALSLVAG
jgi:hypothetical protein